MKKLLLTPLGKQHLYPALVGTQRAGLDWCRPPPLQQQRFLGNSGSASSQQLGSVQGCPAGATPWALGQTVQSELLAFWKSQKL